jgi:propanol-preferring alcohol dehydrogenase
VVTVIIVGYAEYAIVKSRHLIKLPEEIPYEAGILVDAGVTSYHAITRIADLKPGENTMIMGVGGVGLMLLQMSKLVGTNAFAVDINEEKLKLAKRLGASKVINSRKQDVFKEIMDSTDRVGVDAVFETVGYEDTYEMSLNCLGRGGRLVIIGYQPENNLPRVHPVQLIKNEISILTSRAGTHEELATVVKLASENKLQFVVTDKFRLDQINEALYKLSKGEIIGRAVIIP